MNTTSPLLGYNNNVRHKGRVFHIQTEDSGIRHPHIITHLFADGGRILKTTKTSYAEHVGVAAMTETVRALMKEQHKAMFIALRDGHFDHLFGEAPSATPAAASNDRPPTDVPVPSASVPESLPPLTPPVQVAPKAAAMSAPKATEVAPKPEALVAPKTAEAAPPAEAAPARVAPARKTASRPRLDVSPSSILNSRPAPENESPLSSGAALDAMDAGGQPAIELDLDALERAAAEAQTPFLQQIQDLPPPPAAVFGRRPGTTTAGSYRAITPVPLEQPLAKRPTQTGKPHPASEPGGRYAPSRPASIFGTTRPAEGASIFGDELISEKSLDEVILGYLAEDLEGNEGKS